MIRAIHIAAFVLLAVLSRCTMQPAYAQAKLTYSLQSHREVCAQLGPSCDQLSLWTVEVTSQAPAVATISKSLVRQRLAELDIAARDDSSAAAVVLHREKRGGWRVAGDVTTELLYGCGAAALPANLYVSGGCALTAFFAPRVVEKASGYAPRVQESLGRIVGTQHLELAPGSSGTLVVFSTRYADQDHTTYTVIIGGPE